MANQSVHSVKGCIIFNPAACGNKAQRFRAHLQTFSAHCVLKPTYAPGQGHRLAAEAVQEGFETVVAAGGDGTVNEVVNGLAATPQGLARCRLAVLPLGTVNVFAKEIGMPTRLEAAWSVIGRGEETRIDLGVAEFTVEGIGQRRFFVQMAGAGVDARAIELVNWDQKKQLGQFAYWLAGFKAMAGPKPQVLAQSGTQTRTGEQVLVGNGRFYGGKFRLFPQADPRDGLLEVTILRHAHWPMLLRGGWGLLRQNLYQVEGVAHLQAETVTLSSPSRVAFHVEGENAGHLPAAFSVRRSALRVVVPGASRPAFLF